MKKALALSLALGLALSLLAGCEMLVPDPTERPSNWWNSAEPAGSTGPSQSQAPGSADPGPSQAVWKEGIGPDSDRRFVHNHFDFCASEDTAYFSPHYSNLIYYMDKATGICLPLCGKPECTHTDETCNAFAQSAEGLTSYNGRLCWAGQNGTWLTGGGQWYVYSTAYDGTDRRTVRQLTDWEGMTIQTIFHRGYLYRNKLTSEVVNGAAKDVVYVEAYPLEGDGDGIVILRAEVHYSWLFTQAYGDHVYIIFETPDGATELHRWDTRAGELETLFRGEAPFDWETLNVQFWVIEDGIVFCCSEYTGPDEDPTASWELVLDRFSFETRDFEPLNRLHINTSDVNYTNLTILDGLVIANWWDADSDSFRLLVKDFEDQIVLDAALEEPEWRTISGPIGACYGIDEDHLYFSKRDIQYVAVSRDGSEIRLLWTSEM